MKNKYNESDLVNGADGFSHVYTIGNLWQHTKTCRLYRYNGLSLKTARSIASFAEENLTYWNYSVYASPIDDQVLNCATLVWKAYKSVDIELNGFWKGLIYTMLPSDFVEQNIELKMVCNVGWGGDEHKWS